MSLFQKLRIKLRICLRKILLYFSDEKIIKKELGSDLTTPYELRQVFQENRVDYDEIDCPPDFKNEDDFHIILADDNQGALALLEIDLEIILGQSRIETLSDELTEVLDDFDKELLGAGIKFEVQKVGGDYAPYSIYRKIENYPNYRIDFAIIDIIFGGLVYRNDKPLRVDGIALAKYLHEVNPNTKIILFTGSDLSKTSKEYKDIVRYFGESFLKTNVVFKNPNFESRIFQFVEIFKKSFYTFQKRDYNKSRFIQKSSK